MKVSVIKKPADFVKQSRPEDIMEYINLKDTVDIADTKDKNNEAFDLSELDLD